MSVQYDVGQIPPHRWKVSNPSVVFKDKTVRERLLGAAALGMTMKDAAAYANIAFTTLERWMLRGEQQLRVDDGEDDGTPTGPYGEFLLQWNRARAQGLAHSLKKIRDYGDGTMVAERVTKTGKDGTEVVIEKFVAGQWQAHAWLAERTHKDYSLQQPSNLNVQGEVKLVVVEESDWRGNKRTIRNEPVALIEDANQAIEAEFVERDNG